MRLSLLVLSLFLFALVSGCASYGDNSQAGLVIEQKNVFLGSYQSRPAVSIVDGKPAAVLANAQGDVLFVRDGRSVALSQKSDGSGFFYFGLQGSTTHLYATWWTHNNGKKIFVAQSSDGGKTFAPAQIATPKNSQPLPPYYLITPVANGAPALLYSDERQGGNAYHIFINRYDTGTGRWDATDTQLDVGELATNPSGVPAAAEQPTLVQQGANLVLAWSAAINTESGKRYRLLSRSSHDGGKTWDAVTLIRETDTPIFELHGAATNDGKSVDFVYEVAGKGIAISQTDDIGRNWTQSEYLPNSSLNVNSGLVLAAGQDASKGKLFLSWIAQKQISKPIIQAATFDVDKKVWATDQIRIDHKEFDNTQSVMPAIAVNSEGVPLVTWIDYRNILPSVYVSGSFDQGVTWTAPQNTDVDGQDVSVVASVIPDGRKFIVSFDRFPDNTHKSMNWLALAIQPDGHAFAPLPKQAPVDEKSKTRLLNQRLESFWKYRLQGNTEALYDFFDPAYRSLNDPSAFKRQQGYFKYLSYKIKSVAVSGNIATVDVEMTFEIPPMEMLGHKIEQKKRTADAKEVWLYLQGNWYFQYVNAMTGPLMVY